MRIKLDDVFKSLHAGLGIFNTICSKNEDNNNNNDNNNMHITTDFISFGSIA